MKILSNKIKDLLNDNMEYEVSELHDIIEQVKTELEDPDSGDFIIIRGERYDVLKASFSVQNKVKRSLVYRGHVAYMHKLSKDLMMLKAGKLLPNPLKWFTYVPLLRSIIYFLADYRYNRSWNELCKLTFGKNAKKFKLEDLTQEEVGRVMRTFFK
jgi:hypothetical protein